MLNNEKIRYDELQSRQQRDWEDRCLHCGACCGIKDEDPCEHLQIDNEGKSRCHIYENRFGFHKTKSGKKFRCVPVRDILHKSWPGDDQCAYKHNKD